MPFLQHVLTNNCEALDPLQAQYTIVPTETGGAVDDAYLYRFVEDEFLLVVNAANREKDWAHFRAVHRAVRRPAARGPLRGHRDARPAGQDGARDPRRSARIGAAARAAAQRAQHRDGCGSADGASGAGGAGEAGRSRAVEVRIGRTGYTGEPLCFELFVAAGEAPALWDALVAAGAEPVGLGARDTLRLEAGLPLYGHELGLDPEGNEIPIMSCPLASFAVSLSARKGDYVGRAALERQHRAYGRILVRDWSLVEDLPRMTRPVAITGRGIAREGAEVYRDGERVGWVTSGTAVPYWGVEGEGLCSLQTEEHHLRSIALAYVDSRVIEDDEVEVDVRGKRVPGTRRPVPPAQRRAALRAGDRLGLRPRAARAGRRRVRREGPAPHRRRHRQSRVAPAALHRPDPLGDDARRRSPAC